MDNIQVFSFSYETIIFSIISPVVLLFPIKSFLSHRLRHHSTSDSIFSYGFVSPVYCLKFFSTIFPDDLVRFSQFPCGAVTCPYDKILVSMTTSLNHVRYFNSTYSVGGIFSLLKTWCNLLDFSEACLWVWVGNLCRLVSLSVHVYN